MTSSASWTGGRDGWTYEVGACGDSLTTSLADSLHLFLDGDGDYLVIPRHSDLYGNAQQTIEARFRLDHFSDSNSFGWSQLLSNDEYELAIRASDRKLVACCYNAPSTLTSSTEIETGRWYDVAFVRDGSHQRLLLDGIVVASGSTHIVEPSLDLWIGNDPSPPNRPFGGAIDEVRIWRRALTDGEIAANIDRGQVEPSVDLVGYWDFDGSQAAGMVRDRSGNGHHGVLVGDAHLEAEGSEPSPPPTTSSS